jgi:peptidoglycan hydrolase CwlO-like protein
VMKYPNNGIEDASAYLSSGDMEMNDVYIIQLESEIRGIRAEIRLLNNKAGASRSQIDSRTIERKIDELHEEIAELENKIASRQ